MARNNRPQNDESRLSNIHRRRFLKAAGLGLVATGVGTTTATASSHDGSYRGPFSRTYESASVSIDTVETVTTEDPYQLPRQTGEGEAGVHQVPRKAPEADGRPGGGNTPVQTAATESDLTATDFEGLGARDVRGVVPSDNQVAVGSDYIVQAINSRWGVYDKAGEFQFQITLDDWWQNVSPIIYEEESEEDGTEADFFDDYIIFDPRARYDGDSDRYILLCVEFSLNTGIGALLLSVSASDDPTGTWYNYRIPAIVGDEQEEIPGLVDFPQLGYDDEAIYLTQNFFTTVFDEATMVALDKSAAYSGATIDANHFTDLRNPDGSLAFTVQPSSTEGSTTGYFVNSKFFQGRTLTVWSIENGYGSDPSLTNDGVRVRPYHNAPGAEQPDTEEKIDPIDTRIQRVSFDGSTLWATHTVNDGRLRWYHIDPNPSSGASVLHTGNFKREGRSTYMPAIESDSDGTVVLVYNSSSASGQDGYVGAEVATVDGDEVDEFEVYQPGTDDYDYVDPGEGDQTPQVMRWGDYNGIEIDPSGTFWFTAQYTPASDISESEYINDNFYATRIGSFDPA